MVNKVVVYGFETSNNMKVRVALGFKGIDYEFRSIEPRDRADLVRVSGQNLTPVLVHGGCVLFDSAAILRYLDANFPGTPKLFGDSHRQQWEIEDWELFARTELAATINARTLRIARDEKNYILANTPADFDRFRTQIGREEAALREELAKLREMSR